MSTSPSSLSAIAALADEKDVNSVGPDTCVSHPAVPPPSSQVPCSPEASAIVPTKPPHPLTGSGNENTEVACPAADGEQMPLQPLAEEAVQDSRTPPSSTENRGACENVHGDSDEGSQPSADAHEEHQPTEVSNSLSHPSTPPTQQVTDVDSDEEGSWRTSSAPHKRCRLETPCGATTVSDAVGVQEEVKDANRPEESAVAIASQAEHQEENEKTTAAMTAGLDCTTPVAEAVPTEQSNATGVTDCKATESELHTPLNGTVTEVGGADAGSPSSSSARSEAATPPPPPSSLLSLCKKDGGMMEVEVGEEVEGSAGKPVCVSVERKEKEEEGNVMTMKVASLE